MGANWANTLRLWQDVVEDRREEAWEVYAFEASPLIQPYVDAFVAWLNGDGPRPALRVPPAGSSAHLKKYAARYGCAGRQDFRECLFQKFRRGLATLKPDPALNSTAVVEARLAEAAQLPKRKRRYTLVPAAVAAGSGTLQLGLVDAEQMIRGGAHSYGAEVGHGVRTTVPMVNVVKWTVENFHEDDFVFLKLDAEGAEHEILGSLMDQGKFGLLDILLMECHDFAGSCEKLMRRVKWEAKKHGTKLLAEGGKYPGYDSCSTPDRYAPDTLEPAADR